MKRLNFLNTPVTVESKTHPKLETEWKIKIPRTQFNEIVSGATEVFQKDCDKDELMIQLTTHRTLYLKKRETGVRLMLSHPESEMWVAIAALDQASFEKWIAAALGNNSLVMSGVCSLTGINNLELNWSIE